MRAPGRPVVVGAVVLVGVAAAFAVVRAAVGDDPGGPGAAPTPPTLVGTVPPTSAAPDAVPPGEAIAATGNDPVLDTLAAACAGGDFTACDDLYFAAEVGSDHETYGETCGGRNPPGGLCVDRYGPGANLVVPAGRDPAAAIPEFGSDPGLDALAGACFDGDLDACDTLFHTAGFDTGYQAYGDTCGGRVPASGELCRERFRPPRS